MCSWETHILAYLTSFYWNNVARHLWSNLRTCKIFLGEKEFECTKCKATFKKLFQHFCLFMPFWWEWLYALHILSHFLGINDLTGLNDLNNLKILILSKTFNLKLKMYIFDGLLKVNNFWFLGWQMKEPKHYLGLHEGAGGAPWGAPGVPKFLPRPKNGLGHL